MDCFVAALLAMTILPPFNRYRHTPERAARVITRIMTDKSRGTDAYFDHHGKPTPGSTLALDPDFQDRVLAETRAFLASATA